MVHNYDAAIAFMARYRTALDAGTALPQLDLDPALTRTLAVMLCAALELIADRDALDQPMTFDEILAVMMDAGK